MAEKLLFKTKCYHCKEKEKFETEQGITYDLPYAYVDIPKDKDLYKECKAYAKESLEKYKDSRVIKRMLHNGCPKCGSHITICCSDYVDFYAPKKKETNKEEKISE